MTPGGAGRALRNGVAAVTGAGLIATVVSAWAADGARDGADVRTGGDTTVWADGRNAFSFPLANLADDERARFAVGNSFFRRNWVEAPASTRARDGLGPHFIARSCGGCHVQDGRGAPPGLRQRIGPAGQEQPVALLMRLSVPGAATAQAGVVPEPAYGDQFNNSAIPGVRPEGRVTIRQEPIRGRFADGTPYGLRKPVYGFSQLGYGPMRPDVLVSPRIAPQLAGVGLVEAIPDSEILANAQAQAATPRADQGPAQPCVG